MSKFAIVATFEIAPGRIDDVLPLLLAHRERCLTSEPGTLRFDVLRPRTEENRLMLYELYEDDAAFQVHWEGASLARFRTEAAGMIDKISGIRCSVADVGKTEGR